MRLAYAFTANAAEVSPDGKIYILGGDWDRISTASLPVSQPAMALVMKFEVQPTECDQDHELRVELIDMDGVRLNESIILPFRPHAMSAPTNRPGWS